MQRFDRRRRHGFATPDASLHGVEGQERAEVGIVSEVRERRTDERVDETVVAEPLGLTRPAHGDRGEAGRDQRGGGERGDERAQPDERAALERPFPFGPLGLLAEIVVALT